MSVFVLGLGASGRAACQYLAAQGYNVVAADKKVDNSYQEGAVSYRNDRDAYDFSSTELFILSPGISPEHPLVQQAQAAGVEVIGEIELAARGMHHRAIGITGTNGKTTVTLLVAHVLNYCGIPARAVGNVGTPLTEEIMNRNGDEILVIELSSYQLETLSTPILDSAVILNITPDHLDRYGTMENYAKAKVKIEHCLKPEGVLYVERNTFHQYPKLFERQPLLYGFHPDCTIRCDRHTIFFSEDQSFTLPLDYRGKISHDSENLMAAFALCYRYGVSSDAFLAAFATFVKPPHRIEFVRHVHGVTYVDDSKGTNVDAVVRAVESVQGKVVLIAGGVDKGAPFTPWIEIFAGKVKCICAIGEAADKIEQELSHAFSVFRFDDLEGAVKQAAAVAKEGETVLLSPGCASFDMFKDYAHRGEVFKQIVAEL